jgi:adenosylhomocysteine nucleosidase
MNSTVDSTVNSNFNWLILMALAIEERAIKAALGHTSGVVFRTIGIKAARLGSDLPDACDGIILAGLAGGLNPNLAVGDVIIDTSANWPIKHPSLRPGRIYTANHLVATTSEKQQLFHVTACDAVDMEGTIVRQWAESARVPMLHVRAISDSAAQSIPRNLLNWIDPVGKPRPARIAANLALHPAQIPVMIRLGKHSRLALANLAAAMRRIVQYRIDS